MTLSLDNVTVTVSPHPFMVERVTHAVSAGKSVADILTTVQPDPVLRTHACIMIDGHVISPCHWSRVFPKAGSTLTVRMVPQGGGGGGKNPLRTILSIAIMAASPVIATSLAGAFGATGSFLGISTARLITGGVNLLGRLALNAIAPPSRPRSNLGVKEGSVYSIQAAQNKVEPFARVPKILGRHRIVPPLGAMPYTETVGSDQYLRMLFVWGYGPLQIGDLKIGETPISEFDDVEIETRQGYDTDAPLTLYSNAVLQNDLQVALKYATNFVTRSSDADAEELSVDVTFPRGLFKFDSRNTKQAATVELEIQYAREDTLEWSTGATAFRTLSTQDLALAPVPQRYMNGSIPVLTTRLDRVVFDPASGVARVLSGAVHRAGIDNGTPQPPAVPAGAVSLAKVLRRSDGGSTVVAADITDERSARGSAVEFFDAGDFSVVPGAVPDGVSVSAGQVKYRPLIITAKQTTTVRRALSFKVPKGQYVVRIRRLTADATDDNTFDECFWTALRTVRSTQPVRMRGLAMTALRIKATDQLNGVIDRFNGVVQALIPDWTGSAWVVQATSNPASIYRHVLQGVGNTRPLSDQRMDLAKIQDWHAACHTAGYTFNAVIDYDTSVREVLQDVAASGRASPAIVDGRWSVIRDVAQSVPIQHFTPRNTYGFEAQKAFDEQPQALRVRFINADKGWATDERLVFQDTVGEATATQYETLELAGITDAALAWRHGRYHLATAVLRPETYTFSTDLEHIVCTRGDLIRLTHDVPMFGIATGRVSAVETGGGLLTAVTLDAEVTQESGKTYSLRCRRADGSSVVFTLETVPGQSSRLVLAPPVADSQAPDVGDLAMFGRSGQESVELIVKSIEPQSDLGARLTCVDAAPAIHQADQGNIPSFNSAISLNDADVPPPAPQIVGIQSGEEALVRNTDGSLTTRIVITLVPPAYSLPLTTQVMIRAEGEAGFVPANIWSATPHQISIVGVEEGQSYDLQLRYLAPGNNRSLPRMVPGLRVTGTTALPSNVASLGVSVVGSVAHLSWPAVRDIDLSHYVIRHTPQVTDMTWSSAVDAALSVPYDATTLSLPALPGSYLIKAVDVGGRMSEVAAVAVSPAGALSGYNAVLSIQEDSAFQGPKIGLVRGDGGLMLDGADNFDTVANADALDRFDLGVDGLVAEGEYFFGQAYDLGAVYTARIQATLGVQGLDLSTSIDQWRNADAAESWDSTVSPSLWSVTLQISTTNIDPGVSAGWTSWSTLTVGDYTARAFRFRLVLSSDDPLVTPVVETARVLIDMEDRYESGAGVSLPEAGGSISFANAFRAPPTLQVTPRNMASGDYYVIDSVSNDAFSMRFFDSGGVGVSRSFDYVAKGYGSAVT